MAAVRRSCNEPFPTNNIQAAKNICNIMEWFFKQGFKLESKDELNKKKLLYQLTFSFIWGFCASFHTQFYPRLEAACKEFFKGVIFPSTPSIFDYHLQPETHLALHPW